MSDQPTTAIHISVDMKKYRIRVHKSTLHLSKYFIKQLVALNVEYVRLIVETVAFHLPRGLR